MPKTANPYPDWPGFDAPRYTQVPDDVFDIWLPHLSGAELKVLLYICRRTFGFKKTADAISLSQLTAGIRRRDGTTLDHGTGLARSTVVLAVQGLEDKGLIVAERHPQASQAQEATVYHLRLRQAGWSENHTSPSGGWSENRSSPGPKTGRALVRKSNPQETGQETGQETEDSNHPAPAKNGPNRPPLSLYIAAVVEDYSRELGDLSHSASNITQALRLWQESGLDEVAFVAQLHATKKTVRHAQAHGVGNKMAYFFAVLRRELPRR